MATLRSKNRQPIHPGVILREDILAALNMTQARLARCLKVPSHIVFQIVHQRRSIDADLAIRLSKFLGTTPESWLSMQRDYDIWLLMKANSHCYNKIKPVYSSVKIQKEVSSLSDS